MSCHLIRDIAWLTSLKSNAGGMFSLSVDCMSEGQKFNAVTVRVFVTHYIRIVLGIDSF